MANNKTHTKMKQFFIIFVAILLGFSSMAHERLVSRVGTKTISKAGTNAPYWKHIGTPFVAHSVTGETVDLQAILDSGQSVVIAYAMASSVDCWDLHTTGILQALDQMDSVKVIWVEEDNTNTTEAIFGNTATDHTRGDWTRLPSGSPVTYSIIDDDYDQTCLEPCWELCDGYAPAVFFISSTGYYCDVFYKSYGFTYATLPSTAVSQIQNLMRVAPNYNQPPIVRINGANAVRVNDTSLFVADYISLDSVCSVEWRATNYSGFVQTSDTASFAWTQTTPQRVILSVTNTTGTTSDTVIVNVNDWHWGDEMTYAFSEYTNTLGSNSDFVWGVRFPATSLAGRNYLDFVQLYTTTMASYRMRVYQTLPNAMPDMRFPIYDYAYSLPSDSGYHTLPIYDLVPIDSVQDLWVTFTASSVYYPAAVTDYCGDPNSCMVLIANNGWRPSYEVMPNQFYSSWMIKVNTSTDPVLNIKANLPSSIFSGQDAHFSADGYSGAEFEWTFNGASPATAIGRTATAAWNQGGTYLVELRVRTDFDTLDFSYFVDVFDCDTKTLPFRCGFDSVPDLNCWLFYDVDGDGYGWDFTSKYPGTGDINPIGPNSIGSASYINDHGVLTPDNWMITPELAIPAEGATLRYKVGAGDPDYFEDNYSVLVSTSGAEVTDFTDVLFCGTMPTPHWNALSYDLSAYAGQNIRIAFRHHDCSDIYWIFIDELSVTPGNTADIQSSSISSVSVAPNPTQGLLYVQVEGLSGVQVLDVNGREVLAADGPDVDMSGLDKGIYFVRVTTNSGASLHKVVKQ